MHVIFVIDRSSNLAGSKIGTVNDAVVNLLPTLSEISDNDGVSVTVSVLTWAESCDWLYGQPYDATEFIWQDVTTGGQSHIEKAFGSLNDYLNEYADNQTSIILISGGSNSAPYKDQLSILRGNHNFQKALKIAIAIGDIADKELLKNFTGSMESVFTVHNLEAIKRILRPIPDCEAEIDSLNSDACSNHLFLMIDTSGSMAGAKIGAVNDTMDSLLEELQGLSAEGYALDLSVLQFARNCHWMYEEAIEIEDFQWKELNCGGMTSLGQACLKLTKRIENIPKEDSVEILLMSDGCPTDDYDEGLDALNALPIYVKAMRTAIAIGDDADIPSLLKFTGDENRIYKVDALADLLQTIRQALGIANARQKSNSRQNSQKKSVINGDEWD